MKKHRFLVFTCLASLVGLLLAGCTPKTPEAKGEWVVKKVSRKLDLNEEQKQKLIALKDEVLAAKKRHVGEKESMHNEIRSLLLSDRIEEKQVVDLFQRKHDKIKKEFPKVFAKFQDFHASLSKEQKEKAVKLIEKFHKRHHRH